MARDPAGDTRRRARSSFPTMSRRLLALALSLVPPPAVVHAIDNGVGVTPRKRAELASSLSASPQFNYHQVDIIIVVSAMRHAAMGWRHWKAFYAHIDQSIMEDIMEEMAAKHLVDGVPTSLADLGYKYVGLDDHWQNCTTVCPNGTVVPSYAVVHKANGQTDYDYQGCVNATGGKVPGAREIPWYSDGTDLAQGPYGTPQWDTHRFPDVRGMVAKGHSLGLRPGWYMVCMPSC